MSRTVLFYRTVDGKCPVQEFIDSLPGKVAQKIVWVLKLLEDFGNCSILLFQEACWNRGDRGVQNPIWL